ncbi:ABC transporter substrate-binding protein [Rhodopseudomonas sp. HC1]|uniref:ABC transporter substrate-binding protein n=1 Tax=Rhodopseudomonas infernalis TaxID=2897386 RepID=UPI001EE8F047|nr:ABC transporter substrate-binding protein [Rhodopseudomonas infernalis]MCG6206296.1 ABC transporter substrate-binding protein [Rhodopseudomonas infernalis]
MSLRHVLGGLAALVLASTGPVAGARAEPMRISYQPLYWALPFYVASELGYWKEVGIEPQFSVFPAGPQQISAMQSWDLGGTGGPPAVLGGVRLGLQSIAIQTDESAVTATVARAADADAILKNPAMLKGKQLLVTTNSTGEYSALACLKKFGLTRDDVQIVNLAPPQLISAYSNGNGTIAASWAPFAYVLQDKADAKEICNGQLANAFVTSSFVVTSEYAKAKPEQVAKALAVYLRAVGWQKKNRAGTLAYLKKFNEANGVSLSDHFLEIDHDRRKTFTLAEELQIFDRSKGPSTVDKWNDDLAAYLVSTGTLKSIPDAKTYIDDRFLKMIDQDPKLRAFANGE